MRENSERGFDLSAVSSKEQTTREIPIEGLPPPGILCINNHSLLIRCSKKYNCLSVEYFSLVIPIILIEFLIHDAMRLFCECACMSVLLLNGARGIKYSCRIGN